MVDISLQPHVTNAVRKELENLFKGVTLVADRHEAKHEDLVALLKLTDNFGESYSIKLTFSDRQTQKPVVTFFSETSAPKMPEVVWMPHFANLARDVFVPGYEAATTKLVREISRNIQSDHRLAAFLEERNLMITAKSAPIVQQSTLSDEDRLSVTDPRGVQVIGKAPSAFVSEQFGKSWAVVIGIDDYEKAPRLKYAVADAKAMAGVLRQQGFQVTELYNRQASRRAIESELSDKLVDRVGEQDRVVIFYAGHGETKTARGGKTMGYLLPVEGQMGALGETGVSMGRIKELADALPSKQVLFLVDVCYGGIAGQQFRSTLPPMSVAYLKQITRERGRQLITAGGSDQQAMESPEWGHSVFTYYLLEGLGKGHADLNDDGIIPASELYSYLDSRVFSAAQMKGHTQRPELWSLAAEKGEFVFIPSKKDSPAVLTSPR